MALAFGAVHAAPSSGKKLEDVEKQLEAGRQKETALGREAESLSKEAEELRNKAVEAARTTQDREEEITTIERKLDKLNAELASRTAALGGKRAQLIQLLAALERIAIQPPEALIAMPEAPSDTIRSALLIRAAVPAIEDRSRTLQAELDELAELRADIATRRRQLASALDSLRHERERLDRMAEQKSKVAAATEEQKTALAKRNAKLASEAKDIRELLEKLESVRPKIPPPKPVPPTEKADRGESHPRSAAPPASPAPEAQVALRPPVESSAGRAMLPVRGQIIRTFGQEGPAGGLEKGITIETRPDAQVVAPFDGQVAFAGPFRGYGQILIIEQTDGYHTILVGLSRIDGIVGQNVVAGEPVGLMGNPESGRPALYVELRRNGRPVNPVPVLTARNDKVGG
ncbi:MAG: murein hydrolase activator EnvC [Alphaproteobacteria bacterium]